MSEANKQEKQATSNQDHIVSFTVIRVSFSFNRSNYDDPALLEEHMNLLLITQNPFAVWV